MALQYYISLMIEDRSQVSKVDKLKGMQDWRGLDYP